MHGGFELNLGVRGVWWIWKVTVIATGGSIATSMSTLQGIHDDIEDLIARGVSGTMTDTTGTAREGAILKACHSPDDWRRAYSTTGMEQDMALLFCVRNPYG